MTPWARTRYRAPVFGSDRLLELLGRAVGDRAADVDHLEASFHGLEGQFTRFGCSTVLYSSDVFDPKVTVRAVVGGCAADATTTDLTADGLRAVRDQAIATARSVAQSSARRRPAPEPVAPDGVSVIDLPNAFDDATAATESGAVFGTLASAFAQADAHGVALAGRYVTGAHERAIATSTGLVRYFRSTAADARVYATVDRVSGMCGDIGPAVGKLDVARFADVAIEKCVRSKDPMELAPGAYDVILEPAAVAELCEWLGLVGLTPRGLEDGTSFLAGRLGEAVTGDRVTLLDDGRCARGVGLPMPFDREGVLKREVVLIEGGVGRTVVHDRDTAARLGGCASTGHAVQKEESFDGGPTPSHLVFLPGDDTAETLLARVERGLWITSFHYVNGLLDPRRALMTGLTRHGTFAIADGRLGRGVRNLRFTDSVLEAFARIDGVGRELQASAPGWGLASATSVPMLLIRGLEFTGASAE